MRVHPDYLDKQQMPPGSPRGDELWAQRYEDINAFEKHLDRNGTKVIKFFLNVSKDEQKRRFLERLKNTKKHWKFSAADLEERGFWDKYQDAYEDALTATSTESAPWYVIPADHKWVTRAVVADIVTNTIRSLDLRYPELTDAQKTALQNARNQLESE